MTTPKLRFREFSGAWKTGKLGDFAKFSDTRFSADKLNSRNYIGVDNLLQGGGKVDSSLINFANNVPEFRAGDSLFSNIRPYLKKFYFAKSFGGASPDVLVFRPDFAKINPEFLFAIISSDKFNDFVMSGAKGVKMPRGDKSQMMEYEMKIPSLPEQQKIAKFLTVVDARIDAGARKLELLRDYKTAVSRKIFSRQTRFPGFSDEWISRKLGEIAKITTGKLDANAQIVDGKYPFFTTSVETYRINSYSFDGEAILIAGNGQLGMIKAYTGKFDAYQREYVVMDFREISRDYLAGFLRENLPKRISRMSYGSAMPYITLDVLSEMEILAPTLPEQQKIASFLSALDDKISQDSRKLSALREFKKTLLQQMLI